MINYIQCLLRPERLGVAQILGEKSRWCPVLVLKLSPSSLVWSIKWDVVSRRAMDTDLSLSLSSHRKLPLCICRMPVQGGYDKLVILRACTNDRPIYKKKAIRKLVPGQGVHDKSLRLGFIVVLSSSIPPAAILLRFSLSRISLWPEHCTSVSPGDLSWNCVSMETFIVFLNDVELA